MTRPTANGSTRLSGWSLACRRAVPLALQDPINVWAKKHTFPRNRNSTFHLLPQTKLKPFNVLRKPGQSGKK